MNAVNKHDYVLQIEFENCFSSLLCFVLSNYDIWIIFHGVFLAHEK